MTPGRLNTLRLPRPPHLFEAKRNDQLDQIDVLDRATAPFARPAALIAMKLHAIEDRSSTSGQHKRAGDAWDIHRILIDLDVDGSVREAFTAASDILRYLVRDAAERGRGTAAARTSGWMRASDDAMAAVTTEELRLIGSALIDALYDRSEMSPSGSGSATVDAQLR